MMMVLIGLTALICIGVCFGKEAAQELILGLIRTAFGLAALGAFALVIMFFSVNVDSYKPGAPSWCAHNPTFAQCNTSATTTVPPQSDYRTTIDQRWGTFQPIRRQRPQFSVPEDHD